MIAERIWTLVLWLAAAILACSCADDSDDGRMVNSNVVPISSLPYICQLRLPTGLTCGGSLVRDQYVMTAAHCIYGKDTRTMTVVCGATSTRELGVQRKIIKSYMPPEFDMVHVEKDIALLKLDRPMKGANIKSIKMSLEKVLPGQTVRISGWGLLYERGPLSEQLRSAELTVTTNEHCREKHAPSHVLYPDTTYRVTDNMFCAVGQGQGFCNGDSGGPVVRGNTLVGVVSWKYGCAHGDIPGVLARIDTLQPTADELMDADLELDD